MSRKALKEADEFVRKVAGRIPMNRFTKQTYDILGMVRDFMMSNERYTLRSKRKLGSVSMVVGSKQVTVDIVVIDDRNVNFAAGLEVAKTKGTNPTLVINLSPLNHYDPLFVDDKLKPIIEHELTHLIDYSYNPTFNKLFDENELESQFIKDYKQMLIKTEPKFNYTDPESFRGQSIESVARHNAIKVFKTKEFKKLTAKHNIVMDDVMIGKLLRVAYDLYLEDMNFFRDTGGFILMEPRTKEDKDQYKRTRDTSRRLYFNSDAEMKAYTNQIISEVYDFLRMKDKEELMLKFIRDEELISSRIDYLLNQSKTFKENQHEWTEKSLNKIRREVAAYLIKEYSRLSQQEKQQLYDSDFNSEQQVMYRYIRNLMHTNREKFYRVINDENFRRKNESALRHVLKDLEFQKSIETIRKSLPTFEEG